MAAVLKLFLKKYSVYFVEEITDAFGSSSFKKLRDDEAISFVIKNRGFRTKIGDDLELRSSGFHFRNIPNNFDEFHRKAFDLLKKAANLEALALSENFIHVVLIADENLQLGSGQHEQGLVPLTIHRNMIFNPEKTLSPLLLEGINKKFAKEVKYSRVEWHRYTTAQGQPIKSLCLYLS